MNYIFSPLSPVPPIMCMVSKAQVNPTDYVSFMCRVATILNTQFHSNVTFRHQ